MDAASEEVQKLASDLGLRIDQGKDMREPQVVFYYKGEFFHWNHGWLRHHKVKVLHWINKIVHPYKDIHTVDQFENFQDVDQEIREVTPFYLDNDF